MTKNIYLILLLPLFIPQACRCQSSEAEISSIKKVLYSQQSAWNNGDIDGYMKGYWKSDSLVFTSSGNIQRGWNTISQKYKTGYNSKALMGNLSFSSIEVSLLSPGSAWILGHWKIQRNPDNPGGVFTLVLKKFDDGWRIIHDHTSLESER